MSAMAPSNNISNVSSTPKKKANKKKKSKAKLNGDSVKQADEQKVEAVEVDDNEAEAEPETPTDNQSVTEEPIEITETPKANGHAKGDTEDKPEPLIEVTQAPTPAATTPGRSLENAAADTSDASARLEAMSQDREALRAEVEQLRKQLEGIQERHDEELSSVRAELEESEAAKEQAQSQYQNLLGRVNTIKSTLGERLQADRQELSEAKDQIEELESQNEELKTSMAKMQAKIDRLSAEALENGKELTSLRSRQNLSQQNWLQEREDLVKQVKALREEAEAAKEAMGDWEVLAMEERSIREGLADRVAELEDQLSAQRESYERAASERDSQSQAVDGLQRALQEIQEARRVELREMVESTQAQLEALNKLVLEAETKAKEAESSKEALTTELERLAPFEKEVKEKNLLIGKLRHEAIILNDHLSKALRFLKKTKPEDNIDRQIVTNHFLHFLALDRSDPKKFQILQIIAALLQWTDEQKEQAGLARPGASSSSGSSLRIPFSPFSRTPSTPNLNEHSFFPDTPGAGSVRSESLAELWTGFLERQAEEGSSRGGSRAPSVSGRQVSGGAGRTASMSGALSPSPNE